VLLPLASAAPAAAQEVVSADAYAERLERALSIVAAPAGSPAARARAAREAMGLPIVVLTGDGELTIPPDPVLEAAAAGELDDPAVVESHLRHLLDEARRAQAGQPVGEETLRDDLDAAYAAVRGDESLWGRLRRRALELLADLLFRLFRFEGVGTLGAWLLLAAVVAGLVWLVRRLGLGIVPQRRTPAAARIATSPDWRRLAEESLARGDLEGAVRYRYHALLGELAAAGVIRDDPSLTAGEARRAVRRLRPGLYQDVRRATGAFERIAYGRHPAREEDVEAVRIAEEALTR
jgi:hypothetical protein